jgi:DNA-binding transcriptional regulator YdaS (Cro superfamily)
MFRTVVVPLEGVASSEKATPSAVAIARRSHASLRLIGVSQNDDFAWLNERVQIADDGIASIPVAAIDGQDTRPDWALRARLPDPHLTRSHRVFPCRSPRTPGTFPGGRVLQRRLEVAAECPISPAVAHTSRPGTSMRP